MGATAAFGVMSGTSLVSGYSQAQAQKSQADFASTQYRQNAEMADIRATDAISRGERNSAIAGLQTKQNIGSQRAAAAASGVDVNQGSALDLQADTAGQGALNRLQITNNAYREALGYKIEAANDRSSAAFATAAGENEASNTLITGGLKAISYGAQAYGSYKANNGTLSPYTDNNFVMPSFGKRGNK